MKSTPVVGVVGADVTLVIPACDAAKYAQRQVAAIQTQTLKPVRTIVVDSESTDSSPSIYRDAGFEVVTTPRLHFDHGGTRNRGWQMAETPIVLFLTHDAIPSSSDCFQHLCQTFSGPEVGIVSGRQLPRTEARAIERHARLFNYPSTNSFRTWNSAKSLGIRALFNSNAFAAYRTETLAAIGGFPERIIFGEDQAAAARALLGGWTIAYVATATVEHSHGYSLLEEFRRYFDIGVSHKQNQKLLAPFAAVSAEGRRFVRSEMAYLSRHAPLLIPEAWVRTALKLTAFKLGQREAILPLGIKRRLATHKAFFSKA